MLCICFLSLYVCVSVCLRGRLFALKFSICLQWLVISDFATEPNVLMWIKTFWLPQASLGRYQIWKSIHLKKQKHKVNSHIRPHADANKIISILLFVCLCLFLCISISLFGWRVLIWISFAHYTNIKKSMNKKGKDKIKKITELQKWSTCHPVGVMKAWNCLTFFFSPYAGHHQLFPQQRFTVRRSLELI